MSNEAIIRKKILQTISSAGHYPLLEVITHSMQRGIAARLRKTFSRSIEIMLDGKDVQSFGDYFDTLMFPAILCIFEADNLPGKGLVFIEGRFMENAIELLLGFDEDNADSREARTPTAIDRTLIMNLVDQCLEEMSECFFNAHEDIGEINFSTIAIETSPQFAMITTEVAPCHVSRFFLDIGESGYGGRMDFVLPIPMLSPIRRFLEQSFKGDRRGDDAMWQQTLSSAIAKHKIPLYAEIETKDYTIQDVHDWKIGDVIPLHYNHDSNITLTYRNDNETYTLARGMVGQQKNQKALKVSDEVMHIFLEDLTQVLVETDVYTKISETNALTYIRANKDIIRSI